MKCGLTRITTRHWNYGDPEAVAKLRQREGKQNAQTFEIEQVMVDEDQLRLITGKGSINTAGDNLEVLNEIPVESHIAEWCFSSEANQ